MLQESHARNSTPAPSRDGRMSISSASRPGTTPVPTSSSSAASSPSAVSVANAVTWAGDQRASKVRVEA